MDRNQEPQKIVPLSLCFALDLMSSGSSTNLKLTAEVGRNFLKLAAEVGRNFIKIY
jgi:hypothetical protein